jgi:hypothetical protein
MANPSNGSPLHAGSRLAFYASACLIAQVTAIVIFVVRHYVLSEKTSPALGIDFPVYWAAARVAVEHGAAAIYSPDFMAPLEAVARPHEPYTPWAYPPTFLLLIVPFGLLPFGMALASFLAVTIAMYACSIRAITGPLEIPSWRYALAFPALFVVVAFGQNSFLTVSIAGAALFLLPKRPVVAGALIALLSIKPQLGILFPAVLICGRQWRALLSATAFALLFSAAAVLMFGPTTVVAFLHALTAFKHDWLEQNTGDIWFVLTSVYGAARIHGATSAVAYGIHTVVMLPAIGAVAWLWMDNARYELRAAALTVGAMLAPPYFVLYDLAWLALPIAFLAADMKTRGASRKELAIVIAAWLAPLQAHIARWLPFIGQWAPAVLLALIALIIRRHLQDRQPFNCAPRAAYQ